jgi:carbon-monoxide dehydrogenase medium subunit
MLVDAGERADRDQNRAPLGKVAVREDLEGATSSKVREADVKFPPFTYRAPASVAEAVEMLSADPQAKVVAGGQSLLPLLALRLSQPSTLVDLGEIAELSGFDASDGMLRVGAGTTLAKLEDSSLVRDRVPLLAKAIRTVAHRPIRNRATIGGSLAHADPAAELPAVVVALDATLVAQGPSGERRIDGRDFFTGAFTTSLEDDEILTSVEFPVRKCVWSFLEVARRSGDFALVMVAVGAELNGDVCTRPLVVLQGVASKPVRSRAAEEVLDNSVVDDEVAAQTAEAATSDLRPPADIHASSDYRKRVAATLVRRAALEVGRRAQ